MTVSLATLARLKAQIAKLRRAAPVSFAILDQLDGESTEAFRLRVAETERRFAALEAKGGRAFLMVIGDEEAAA